MGCRQITLVAGGSGLIGSAVCRDLYANQMDVLSVSRHAVSQAGVESLALDLSNPGDREALVCAVRQRGVLKGLVCCLPSSGCGSDGDLQIMVVEALAPLLKETGGAAVLLSSTAARMSFATGNARFYAAQKAGLEGYVKVAARELSPMRINAVAPGLVETNGMLRPGSVHARVSPHCIPIGRFVKASEIASVIREQLVNVAITGQIFTVDGGLTSSFGLASGERE